MRVKFTIRNEFPAALIKPGIFRARAFLISYLRILINIKVGSKNIEKIDLTTNSEAVTFLSRLSFQPLLNTWKKKIEEGEEGTSSFYKELLEKISAYPELLQPVQDLSILKKHQPLLNIMMSTVFPVIFSDKNDLYAVAVPFTYQVIYSSQLFQESFIRKNSNQINVGDETSKEISKEKLYTAYQLILNKFYGAAHPVSNLSIHPYKHQETGLERFMELELDARFVEVKVKGILPELPASFLITSIPDIVNTEDLQQLLPLNKFEFEGMMLVKVNDVTEQQIINEIKNNLLTINAFTETSTFDNLETQMQNLIGLQGLKIGITPFLKINRQFVFSDLHKTVSLLFHDTASIREKNDLYIKLDDFFSNSNSLLIVSEITEASLQENPFIKHLFARGIKSLIIYPLINENELLGTLEIISEIPGQLTADLMSKISPAIPLFTLSLEKSAKNLEAKIDAVIKEQFTVVQNAVEWRFTEAALKYISDSQKNEEAKIETIVFEKVHPLYGAIDIRNSSVERNQAIQQDLSDQLQAVNDIVIKAQQETTSALLNEIKSRLDKYINAVSGNMASDDEFEIYRFLTTEVKEMFKHLQSRLPVMKPAVEEYFSIVDSDTKTWNFHRKEFEDSITYINSTIARFIDIEQLKAQQLFPHYFERFVTDGVDFNIYIGQSVSPQKTFTSENLQQLKMWQLNIIIKSAILGKRLELKSPVPLQTTQLILTHSEPISISFRAAERKFDVDGAYNIRYEIIKKRIDKVHIKDTGERLTQPGMLAVVYTQPDEGTEYIKFFESLQQEGLLKSDVQEYELEELQGVSSLKALRVGIILDQKDQAPQKKVSANL